MRTHVFAILAIGVLLADSAVTAAEPEIVFAPPPSVRIRKTDGSAARGRLLGIDADTVKVRILSGKEIELDVDDVRMVQQTGPSAGKGREQFNWRPPSESFDELVARIRSVPGARLMGASDLPGSPDIGGNAREFDRHGKPGGRLHGKREDAFEAQQMQGSGKAEEARRANFGNPQPRGENPFGNLTRPNRPVPADPERQDDDPEFQDGPAVTSVRTLEIMVCGNCEKDLPVSFRSGDKCPHCGQIAVFAEESAELAATDPPQANPFEAPGAGGIQKQAFVAPPPAASAQQAQSAAPASGQGLSMSNLPMTAKIGIFVGFLIVGWLLLSRR